MTTSVSLSDLQLKKLRLLTEKAGFDYESDNANSRSIYNFYAQRYGIIIINDWGGDNDSQYTVIDAKTKALVNGKELDLKIAEILETENKSKRTVEHVKNNNDGKIHTITSTAYVQPNSKTLEAILSNIKAEIPPAIKIEAARKFQQKIYSEIKDLTLEEQIIRQIELAAGLQMCNDVVAESFKLKKAKAYREIQQEQFKSQIKANKKAPRTPKPEKVKHSKQDAGIWNMLPNGATQEQFEAKKAQMRALGLLEILEKSKDSSPKEEKKFNISTTKSKEESYG